MQVTLAAVKNLFRKKDPAAHPRQDAVAQPDKQPCASCENCPSMFLLLKTARQPHGREAVQESRIWYYEQCRRYAALSFALIIVLGLAICLNIAQFFSRPSAKYFATDQNLRVVELKPTDQPHISQEKLINWVTETVCRTFTLDFLNYRQTLMDVRPNYSKGAYKSMLNALEDSGNLDMITSKRLVSRATLSGTAVVTKEGVVKGHRMWKLELPMIISYESSNGIEANQNVLGSVIVRREDEREVPRGVLIYQVILKPR